MNKTNDLYPHYYFNNHFKMNVVVVFMHKGSISWYFVPGKDDKMEVNTNELDESTIISLGYSRISRKEAESRGVPLLQELVLISEVGRI